MSSILFLEERKKNQVPAPSVRLDEQAAIRPNSTKLTPDFVHFQVTDTRITPRVVSRILSSQDGNSSQGGADSPPPPPPPPAPRNPYAHAPPHGMLPVSLPTSVAIPNPSLHESQVFSPYSPFFNPHPGQVPPPGSHHHLPASPPGAGGVDIRDSPPLPPHPPAMLHPALLAAAQHGNPDFSHLRMDSNDRGSDCNSGEISYDGIQPTISFFYSIINIYVVCAFKSNYEAKECSAAIKVRSVGRSNIREGSRRRCSQAARPAPPANFTEFV